MSTLHKTPVLPDRDADKALVLHSSAYRLNQPVPQSPPPPPAAAQGLGLDLFDSLYRHWKLAVLVFAAIATMGTLWAVMTMRPVYVAETTIYIPQDLGRGTMDGVTDGVYATLVNQQIMTILHYDTLSEAIQLLKKEGVYWRLKGENEQQAVDRLKSSLVVQRVPDSYEVMIQMTSSDARTAALVANSVARSFLDADNRPDATGRMDRGTALLKEKAALEQELQRTTDLKAKLAESLQVVNIQKSTIIPDDQDLMQSRQALAIAHRRRIEAEEKLKAGPVSVEVEAEQIASADPATRSWEANLLQQKFQLEEKIKTMTPAHPIRKDAEAQIAEINTELKQDGQNLPKITAQLMAKLRAEAVEARRIEEDLSDEISRETAKIPLMEKNLAQADYLTAEIFRLQGQLSHVESQIDEVNNRTAAGSSMRVFSAAQAPTAPVKSQRVKALSTAFALALLLALGLPVAIDLIDSRIYDAGAVERILGFPVVGMTIARSPKTEQFADEHLRRLVSAIERAMAGGARTVLLTGLKQPVSPSIMRDISRQLSARSINVSVRAARPLLTGEQGSAESLPADIALTDDLEDCDLVLMEAPALVFSAEAERMAAKADITLVVVQAGKNTRPDLVRGARLLERLNVQAVGVIVQDVRVERAGRSLRRDLREYMALHGQLAGLTGSWVGW
jgi:capsular polysaccharide biosynthesis protein